MESNPMTLNRFLAEKEKIRTEIQRLHNLETEMFREYLKNIDEVDPREEKDHPTEGICEEPQKPREG